MLHSVSWENYWIATSVSCAIYYLFIYFLYFRPIGTISIRATNPGGNNGDVSIRGSAPSTGISKIEPIKKNDENVDYLLHACIDELNAFFDGQRKTKAIKSQLLFSLYTLLQKYPSLVSSGYKQSLTNIIATQCEAVCSIRLSAEELKGVWFGW